MDVSTNLRHPKFALFVNAKLLSLRLLKTPPGISETKQYWIYSAMLLDADPFHIDKIHVVAVATVGWFGREIRDQLTR